MYGGKKVNKHEKIHEKSINKMRKILKTAADKNVLNLN